MIAEIDIDIDKKIILRTLTGEIDTGQALKLVQNVAKAVNLHPGYHILVDIRDTTFHPEMIDLLDIAAECSRQLIGFSRKIAFLIPDTEQRKLIAKMFKSFMDTEGFAFKQFIDYDRAAEWLVD
ncbi:MAG: hypothetical protein QNJ61_02395 [Desulfobacterales bacterium]|nr:hypothetical protein [Desulfobacterales bacterium]